MSKEGDDPFFFFQILIYAMKTNDYLIDLMKKRIPETLEPSDTAYGAFCKGYRYAKEEWISDKMPEEFEDLLESGSLTKQVIVLLDDGEHEIAQRFLYSATGMWIWDKVGAGNQDRVLAWKCVD